MSQDPWAYYDLGPISESHAVSLLLLKLFICNDLLRLIRRGVIWRYRSPHSRVDAATPARQAADRVYEFITVRLPGYARK